MIAIATYIGLQEPPPRSNLGPLYLFNLLIPLPQREAGRLTGLNHPEGSTVTHQTLSHHAALPLDLTTLTKGQVIYAHESQAAASA